MNPLFESGNLLGYLGLSLIIFAGCRLAQRGRSAGWLVALSAGLFFFAQIFSTFVSPALVGPIHLTFSRFMITFVTALPTITYTLGFVLIPCALLLLVAQERQFAAIKS